jgi:hypothetical protein
MYANPLLEPVRVSTYPPYPEFAQRHSARVGHWLRASGIVAGSGPVAWNGGWTVPGGSAVTVDGAPEDANATDDILATAIVAPTPTQSAKSR